MVSFVETSGLKAFFTVLIVVQVLVLSLKKAVTNHAVNENRLVFKYSSTTTAIEDSNKKELKDGIIDSQYTVIGLEDRGYSDVLRILQPKDAKATKAPIAKESKAPKETKAPIAKETKAPTIKNLKVKATKVPTTAAPSSPTSAPLASTTSAPLASTTPAPLASTTPAPLASTTPAPLASTTPAPVSTSTEAPASQRE
jgi:hypothetical protein